MRHPTPFVALVGSFVVAALAFAPDVRRPSLCSPFISSRRQFQTNSRLYEAVEKGVEEATEVSALEVEVKEAYPNAKILTMELKEHVPLGCTVEESMDTKNDPSIVFVSKVVEGGNAEKVGIKVGDVIIGVTGLFGDMTPVFQSGIEKIKGFVASVPEEEPLLLQLARGTGVLERHEAAVVDLCQSPGSSDKEVEDCVVDFLASGYDTSPVVEPDDIECAVDDDSADCMLDNMMALWADELPPPPTMSGITDANNGEMSAKKPKPWSSRSSPSGTFVRDPVTGQMRNIDA